MHELDLLKSIFDSLEYELANNLILFSLQTLSISIDHPLEFFKLLFQIAPFLQYMKLIQTLNSSLKISTVHFIICLCQNSLKSIRHLHIQLRSVSDQIFLGSFSVTSTPISYEVITC